ncbi:hypothetical protein T05_10591 [Trichinella murrelli]|uniref:Uncharacterized protein n=1 Tax=Trichinella murrelli TaxID=144512 RepID=A0A0V0U2L8_9BILA|nr:hypothetical protein T05_10591 [Trichinella murrelli]
MANLRFTFCAIPASHAHYIYAVLIAMQRGKIVPYPRGRLDSTSLTCKEARHHRSV